MSAKRNIEELFNSALGEAEISPSAGAWEGVQRKLRMKQFLRFEAARFNAYYLGSILAAASVVLALMLADHSDSSLSDPQVEILSEQLRVPIYPAPAEVETQANENRERTARNTKQDSPDNSGIGKEDESADNPEDQQEVTPSPLITEQDIEAVLSENENEGEKPQKLITWFSASQTEGCTPLLVKFTDESLNATSLTWKFGNGESSSVSDPVYLYGEAGTYAVSLTARGIDGQEITHHKVIRVYPSPVAGFEIAEGVTGLNGQSTLEIMNYSTGGFSSNWELVNEGGKKVQGWSSAEFQPSLRKAACPEQARAIRMVVRSDEGCTDTALATIPLLDPNVRQLKYPTAFSANPSGPTGGHYNPNDFGTDVFHPRFSEKPAEYHLKIFSRMGDLLFETRELLQGWDGYFQQERTAGGVYLWVVTGTWENGTSFSQSGDVTLLWSDRWP